MPAIAKARWAAAVVAGSVVMSARDCSAMWSEAWPTPAMRMIGRPWASVRAVAMSARTTAAAPSVIGEQSRMFSGSATFAEESTSLTVICWRNWACGLSEPWRWFFTATIASCSRVVPQRAMCARAIIA